MVRGDWCEDVGLLLWDVRLCAARGLSCDGGRTWTSGGERGKIECFLKKGLSEFGLKKMDGREEGREGGVRKKRKEEGRER